MTTSHPNAMAKFKRSRTGRVVWWIWPIIGIVLLFMLSIMIYVFGNVSGIEISRQDLTFREFNYRQIPGLRWQIGAVYHDFPSSAATEPAIANHLKPLGKGEKVEWDLIQFEEFGANVVQGDAAILHKILIQRDDLSAFYWVRWASDHPKRAAELWPTIQDLAYCNMYWAIPPLMEMYNSGTNDSSLIPERNEAVIESAKAAIQEAKARGETAAIEKIVSRLTPYDELGALKEFTVDSAPAATPSETKPTTSDKQPASAQ
jgi:hypothetical protein